MTPPPIDNEWRVGWRIVLASAIANGTGISLMFYCFSLFVIPMSADLGLSRADTGTIQTLIITAVLGAPLIGRLTDLLGFRIVFFTCSIILTLIGVAQGLWVSGFWSLALTVGLAGFLGSGSSSVALTLPVNAHFRRFRGRALGLVGIGVSVTTILVPPLLQQAIAIDWRYGFLALAALSGLVGLPAVLLLMPRQAGAARRHRAFPGGQRDWAFLRERHFWLLSISNLFASMATGGAISQLAPMIDEHGLSPEVAALGLSFFAAGQFIGKLGGGWLLDRFEPRKTAAMMTIIPGLGFLAFINADPGMAGLVLAACAMIGALSGADIDIYAFFTARRFGIERYGTVFGAMHALSWIGVAGGITLFTSAFESAGSYAFAQYAAIALLILAASLLYPVRLPASPGSTGGEEPAIAASGVIDPVGGDAQA